MSRYLAPIGLAVAAALTYWAALHAGPPAAEVVDDQAEQHTAEE